MPHQKKPATKKETDPHAIECKQEKDAKTRKKPSQQQPEHPTLSIPSSSSFLFERKSTRAAKATENGQAMTQTIASKCLKGE